MAHQSLRQKSFSLSLMLSVVLAWPLGDASAQSQPQQVIVTPGQTFHPSNAEATPEQLAEARTRFNRALELADDGDFDASLLELQRAYDLAPSYRILYNVGLVCQQLKEYARAYDAFERYISEGGSEVPRDRAEDVAHRIERLRGRTGYLWVTATVPGVEVSVDDVAVGQTPLPGLLRVNSGQRRITVRLAGHPTESRVIELAGGERQTAAFDLRLPVGPGPSPSKSPVPYIAWGVTAGFTAAAVTTGILALTSTSSYDSLAAQLGVQPAALSSAWEKARVFSITTDALIGAALISAGASVYLTIRSSKKAPTTGVWIGPGTVVGRF